MNIDQADDFLRKYLQDNIVITNLSYFDEDGIYFLKINSGKEKKITTEWQYRPGLGLCFGRYTMLAENKAFDVYYHSKELLDKANEIAAEYIDRWNKVSPV